MGSETQITFDDVLDENVPDVVYSHISDVADELTASERERSGDNCATVSRQVTDDESFTFCIQLPPRSNTVSRDVIESVVSDVVFVSSEVVVDDCPPYTVWEFDIDITSVEAAVRLVIVKPVEEPIEDSEEESFVESYEQFDFTRFVRSGE